MSTALWVLVYFLPAIVAFYRMASARESGFAGPSSSQFFHMIGPVCESPKPSSIYMTVGSCFDEWDSSGGRQSNLPSERLSPFFAQPNKRHGPSCTVLAITPEVRRKVGTCTRIVSPPNGTRTANFQTA
jgi:hypothetical protein